MPKKDLVTRKVEFTCTYSSIEDLYKKFLELKENLPKGSYSYSELDVQEDYATTYVYATIYYLTEKTQKEIDEEKATKERELSLKRKYLEALKKELGDV